MSRFIPCFIAVITLASWCGAQETVVIDPSTPPQADVVVDPGEGEDGEMPPLPPAPKPPAKPAPEAKPKPPSTEEKAPELNGVRLQGLNKVTARISTLEAHLGTVMRFGRLEIIAHRCWQAPPEERPESAALLEIRELKLNSGPQTLFSGWMFASSPALLALEHPVYDITVLACVHLKEVE